MSDFPEDMSQETRLQLEIDLDILGQCWYEKTEDGYERKDPLKFDGWKE